MTGLAIRHRDVVEQLRLERVWENAQEDPKVLIAELRGFDPTQQEEFSFEMFPAGADPYWPYPEPRSTGRWLWQAEIVDWWNDPVLRKFITLKARQLGITWLAVAYGLWAMLFRPGAACVAYSYDEEASKKLIQRAWRMLQTLPPYLWRDFEVVTPDTAILPSQWIRLLHKPTGFISTFQALPATKRAGHGDTIFWGIMDEVSRMEYAREIYTAINPATSRGGRLLLNSTANGVSNEESGEGNFFHHVWVTADDKGIAGKFLPWHLHPERGDHGDHGKRPLIVGGVRDPDWYQREAMALPTVERNQQYPLNENDAFMLSGSTYFEVEDLAFYARNTSKAIFAGVFDFVNLRRARLRKWEMGPLKVYRLPEEGVTYVMSADSASGTGADRSVSHVLDARNGQVVAFFRTKLSPNEFGDQLYWIGKWYNTAKIGVEIQGGWGEAVISRLRDGGLGRPVYSNLSRFEDSTRGKRPISEKYGVPMNKATRPIIVGALYKALRDRLFPYLPSDTVGEMQTFVYRDTGTSPAAQDGCHDDCVMSLAIASHMMGRHTPSLAGRRLAPRKGYQPLPTRTY